MRFNYNKLVGVIWREMRKCKYEQVDIWQKRTKMLQNLVYEGSFLYFIIFISVYNCL